jgi:hypothetical protein
MATGEDQAKPIVFQNLLLIEKADWVGMRLSFLRIFFPWREPLLAPQAVDGPEAPRRYKPSDRISRNAVDRPPFGCRLEGVVQGFLSSIEAAEQSNERRKNAEPVATINLVDDPIDHHGNR